VPAEVGQRLEPSGGKQSQAVLEAVFRRRDMRVLVVGGAGYIGSHAVKMLRETGHTPVVVDNLSRGHRQAVPDGVPLYQMSGGDMEPIQDILKRHAIECVMHFAAFAYVGESVEQPLAYYQNNVAETIRLLQAMEAVGVERIVFSSTCATYGEPARIPITEDLPQEPINPYGRSKLMVEKILADYAASHPQFSYAALRYFNVAGAARDGTLGEDHRPETHLIPSVLLTVLGQRDRIVVFGTDYPTPDGTCIRDYIHVEDLCAAHILVMEQLRPGKACIYNLGIGRGYSVKEVIDAVQCVTGKAVPVEYGPRRPGDPAVLYADATKIRTELGWQPQVTSIEEIVETAWRWHMRHPTGYGS